MAEEAETTDTAQETMPSSAKRQTSKPDKKRRRSAPSLVNYTSAALIFWMPRNGTRRSVRLRTEHRRQHLSASACRRADG